MGPEAPPRSIARAMSWNERPSGESEEATRFRDLRYAALF
jgi:hypothetical protein